MRKHLPDADRFKPTKEAQMATSDSTTANYPIQQPKTKRQRGDGSVYKRGSTWWIAFHVNGRLQRESAKTDDEQKALKTLRARLKEVHAHELDPTKPFITQRDRRRAVAELLDALKSDFEIRGIASNQALSNIKRAKADFGMIRATSLTADAIDQYIEQRLADGHAKASINRVTQLVKQAYKLAELPAPKIRKLDESDNVRRGFFSESEVRRVMANLPFDLADFTLFGWLTGMRKGEIASLAWEDVDGDCIRLRAENAKNGTARMIPLEGELAELIARRKAARQVKVNDTVMLSSLIFHRNGLPIREFRKSWKTACTKAGISRLFHDLRRSACRNMVAAGVAQVTAMQVSGHKTDSMFRRYAICSESDLRTALRTTQQYLKTVKEKVVAMGAD
jgi:integrase